LALAEACSSRERQDYCVAGVESRKSLIIGAMMSIFRINVTCVVSGTMAKRDAERGRMSRLVVDKL
jgi:hypothetical protein